jgi:hypothetical protein
MLNLQKRNYSTEWISQGKIPWIRFFQKYFQNYLYFFIKFKKNLIFPSVYCFISLFLWKKQYLAEINGQTPKSSKAMTPEQQEIQSLKKQLWRSQRDNEILKKATALIGN